MKIVRLAALGCLLLLSALASAHARPEDFRAHVSWFLPPGSNPVPLVILIEGTGGFGPNTRHPWVGWFNARGIAVAQVRSAASRGRSNWSGTSCALQYRDDASDVVELARLDQSRIDLTRFAIMGLSRGGTEVLNSARSFRGSRIQPTAVFALYPGCEGWCQTDYPKDGPTGVYILYGDKDDWGQYRDSFSQCRRLAGGKIEFHSLPGAHHGFDGTSTGTFTAAGKTFRYEPNAAALEQARAIVWQALSPSWGLR